MAPFAYLRQAAGPAELVTESGELVAVSAGASPETTKPDLFSDRGSNVALLAERVGLSNEQYKTIDLITFSRRAKSVYVAALCGLPRL